MRAVAAGAVRASLLLAAMIAAAVALGGCASTPARPAGTTVVLMPDEDGQVGAVVVSATGRSQAVDQAFSATTVQGPAATPTAPAAIDRAALEAAHAEVLQAQPPKPLHFVLHFVLGKAALTDESKAQLARVVEAARQRKPAQITVFGHADASGPAQANQRLAAERAESVARLLRQADPELGSIGTYSFGDTVPLVDAGPRGSEPRNRRAEVQIL